MTERERLIGLVQRIMDGDYSSDDEVQSLVAEFEAAVLAPGASSLIFWPSDEFDHEPTAAHVVDRGPELPADRTLTAGMCGWPQRTLSAARSGRSWAQSFAAK